MRRKLIALGLVVILILTSIVSIDLLGVIASATSSENNSEVINEGIDADALMQKATSINFINDGDTMTKRLYQSLNVAGIQCTVSNLESVTRKIDDKVYFESPTYISIIQDRTSSRVVTTVTDIKQIDGISKSEIIRLTVIQNGSSSEWEYKYKNDSEWNIVKEAIKGFFVKLQQVVLKCLMEQSVVVLLSSVKNISCLADIMIKSEEDGYYSFNPAIKNILTLVPDYLLHPLLGKISGGTALTFLTDCDDSKYLTDITNRLKTSNKKLYFEIHSEYVQILGDNYKRYFEGYDILDKEIRDDLNLSYKFKFELAVKASKQAQDIWIEPDYLMSYLYPLAIPDNFVVSGGNKNICVMENYNKTPKYLCLDGIGVNVRTNGVYGYNENGEYMRLGDFAKFNIDRNYIYLHNSIEPNMSIDEFNKKSEESQEQYKRGIAVCTKVYEAIWDTTKDSGLETDDLRLKTITQINNSGGIYPTGRQVLFNRYYISDMPFDNIVKNTIQLSEVSINKSTYAKFFAFSSLEDKVVNASKKEFHFRANADSFRFQAALVHIEDVNGNTEFSGICLIRNNYYANDASLINWITSAKAKGISYVNADALFELLNSSITAKDNKLTYEQFGKLEIN